jgi:hypothetical protein
VGFLDKAKQAAQQAQQKLDEAQKSFNQSQAGGAQQTGAQGGAPVRYDEHGRPIQADPSQTPPVTPQATPPAASQGTPPAAAPPASPDVPPPAADQPVASAAAPPAEQATETETEPQSDAPLKDDVNQNPDPFRPIQ